MRAIERQEPAAAVVDQGVVLDVIGGEAGLGQPVALTQHDALVRRRLHGLIIDGPLLAADPAIDAQPTRVALLAGEPQELEHHSIRLNRLS